MRREEEDRLLGETRFYRVFPIPAMSSPPFLRGHFLTHRGRYNSERRQRKYTHTHARVHCATVLCRLKERSWLPPGLHRLARTNGPFFFFFSGATRFPTVPEPKGGKREQLRSPGDCFLLPLHPSLMVCRIDGAGLPAHHHRVAPSNADRPEICPRAGETGTSRQNRVDNRLLYKLFPPLLLFSSSSSISQFARRSSSTMRIDRPQAGGRGT